MKASDLATFIRDILKANCDDDVCGAEKALKVLGINAVAILVASRNEENLEFFTDFVRQQYAEVREAARKEGVA